MFKNRWRRKVIKEIEQLPRFTFPECCAVTQRVLEKNYKEIVLGKGGKK